MVVLETVQIFSARYYGFFYRPTGNCVGCGNSALLGRASYGRSHRREDLAAGRPRRRLALLGVYDYVHGRHSTALYRSIGAVSRQDLSGN